MPIWNDIRLAARLLLKERWFTLAAAGALALGIAATTSMFSLTDAILLRALPFEGADRTLLLTTENTINPQVRYSGLSYQELGDWQRAARTFDAISGYSSQTMNVVDDLAPAERFEGVYISGDAFTRIGERPAIGRDFRSDDDRVGAEPVALLGDGVWRARYGARPDVIGRVVRINGVAATVIGVMRPGFAFPYRAEIWMPLAQLSADVRESRAARPVTGFGHLKTGTTEDQARADLAAVAAALTREHADVNAGVIPRIRPFRANVVGQQAAPVFSAVMASVGFVLLIACANVANLLLARAARRGREIAVRMSLGATRGRVVRQLLVESLLLAGVAGTIGLVLSATAVGFLDRMFTAQEGAPYWIRIALDARVFTFFAAICLGTTVLFGLLPALHLSRTGITAVLQEASRGYSIGTSSRRWAGGLVIVQVAMTVVLLAGAGLGIRNLVAQIAFDSGIGSPALTVAQITLAPAQYPTEASRARFYQRLEDGFGASPGLQAAVVSTLPGRGGLIPAISVEGASLPAGGTAPSATYLAIGLRYFDALGTAAPRGRGFTAADRGDVAIVNERFAAMYFAGQDALGRRIRLEATPATPQSPWLTVVGVAPNVRQRVLDNDPGFDAVVYRPYAGVPLAFATIVARSENAPGPGTATVTPALRDVVRAIDADLPLWDVTTFDVIFARDRFEITLLATMFGSFAGIALVLSAIGIYAVTAYAVVQRTREIGVRTALGARAGQLWWLVTRRACVHLMLGLAIGTPGAWAVGQLLAGELDAISATDPTTYGGVIATLVLVVLAACIIPARRAIRLNPIVALRAE